jgi:hypothetical protein
MFTENKVIVFTKLHGLYLPIIHRAMYTRKAKVATYKVCGDPFEVQRHNN